MKILAFAIFVFMVRIPFVVWITLCVCSFSTNEFINYILHTDVNVNQKLLIAILKRAGWIHLTERSWLWLWLSGNWIEFAMPILIFIGMKKQRNKHYNRFNKRKKNELNSCLCFFLLLLLLCTEIDFLWNGKERMNIGTRETAVAAYKL